MMWPKIQSWKNSDAAKYSEPTGRGRIAEGNKGSCHNSKRRRMTSVLDAVIETTKALILAPAKKIAEATIAKAKAETVPSVSVEMKPAATEKGTEQESLGFGITIEKEIAEEAKSPDPRSSIRES